MKSRMAPVALILGGVVLIVGGTLWIAMGSGWAPWVRMTIGGLVFLVGGLSVTTKRETFGVIAMILAMIIFFSPLWANT